MSAANILRRAGRAPKGSWTVYNNFKRQISALPLSADKYEEAISKLVEILRV